MQVAPTLLNYSEAECIEQFDNLSIYFKRFQIDIQDGKFINNKTIELEDYFEALKKSDKNKVLTSLFDFHFQTLSFYEKIAELSMHKDAISIGILLIHHSLQPNFEELKKKYPYFSFGLVLNPEDEVEKMKSIYKLDRLSGIQIMSIHPGPQGTQFMPETLNKLEQLRLNNYRSSIYLDGGINETTLPIIKSKKYTPDYLCIGSFLTKSHDLQTAINLLKTYTS